MKLIRVEMSNYKSIKKASLNIDRQETILMGRNDVGKSNILQAILCFGSRSKVNREDKCKHAEDPTQPSKFIFHYDSFSEEEIGKLSSLPIPIIPKNNLSVIIEADVDNIYQLAIDDNILNENSKMNVLGIKQDENATIDSNISEKTTLITPELWNKTIDELWKILPKIILFKSPGNLPGKVTIDELQNGPAKFDIVRKLLNLAGVQSYQQLAPDDVADGIDYRASISRSITELLRNNWLQDEHLSIEINYQAPHLLFTYREATNKSTYPEQHSEATSEYIAILIDLLDKYQNVTISNNLLLLFDEPGIRLHPGGQRDLKTLLIKLSQKNQIILTTHSTSLINRNYPGQIRLIKKGNDGTEIIDKPSSEDKNYYVFPYDPIRNEIGLSLGESLLFDENNVVLEGPSDQIIIGALSQKLSLINDPRALELNNTALIPSGSSSTIELIANMAKTRKLKVVALYDSDESGLKEIKKVQTKAKARSKGNKNLLLESELIQINDVFSEKKTRCIEDLIPTKLYLEATNKFYSSIIPTWKDITSKDLPRKEKDEPIAKLLISYFEDPANSDFGDFDKVRVARELASILLETEILKVKGEIRQEFEPAIQLIGALRDILLGNKPKLIESDTELKQEEKKGEK